LKVNRQEKVYACIITSNPALWKGYLYTTFGMASIAGDDGSESVKMWRGPAVQRKEDISTGRASSARGRALPSGRGCSVGSSALETTPYLVSCYHARDRKGSCDEEDFYLTTLVKILL